MSNYAKVLENLRKRILRLETENAEMRANLTTQNNAIAERDQLREAHGRAIDWQIKQDKRLRLALEQLREYAPCQTCLREGSCDKTKCVWQWKGW